MKNYTIIFCLLIGLSANAQNWRNLKYSKFQAGLEHNPYKGFATMWDVQTDFPNSIQGVIFKFNDIVIGDSLYDWTVVDNFMTTSAAAGKHVSLQVNIDPVKNAQLDLPQYLLDSLSLDSTTFGQSDLVYYDEVQTDGSINALVSPNWNNPTLMKAMVDFIGAFGDRYNGDDRIFNVAMGLYGMWGEWHVFPFQDTFPHLVMTQTNQDLIANKYLASFPNSNVVARYPQSTSTPNSFGYSDGLFFEHSIGLPYWYFNNLLTTHAANSWQTNPIGGEVSPELQDTVFHFWPNLEGSGLIMSDGNPHEVQNMMNSIKATHSTWLFANYLYADPSATNITLTEKNNAKKVHLKLGYSFFLNKYRLLAAGGVPTLKVRLKNKGIAPIYANWDVEFAVLDSTDSIISLKTQKWGINNILPSGPAALKSITSSSTLNDGSYTILLRIKNPLDSISNNAPPLRFANETQDLHKNGWLSIAQMTIINGSIGNVSDAVATGAFGSFNRMIPGNIEGEHFDYGGLGVAYQEDTIRKGNKKLRPSELVDIAKKQAASNGFTVGYSKVGEWLNYTVDVAETKRYDITLKYFSKANPGDLKVSLDGVELVTITGLHGQGDWQTPATIQVKDVDMVAGTDKILTLEFVNGARFDIDALVFNPSGFIKDGIYTIEARSGAFLRPVAGGGNLKSSTVAMGDSTRWMFTHLGDDVYEIESRLYSGERMQVGSNFCGQGELVGSTTASGTADNLKWKATEEGNYITFQPQYCLNFAIDAWSGNDNVVHIYWKDTTNDNQMFQLIEDPNSTNMAIVNTALGINSNTSNAVIAVYPNPVKETLNISISNTSNSPSEIKIFDIRGKLLYSEIITKQEISIDSEVLKSSGMFIVQITNRQETKSFKIVKR
ncbi:MAG: T9SS type A sorting domain-containing protein [Crocinitomicaceae bacterium]